MRSHQLRISTTFNAGAASPHSYRSHQCCECLQTSVLRAASPPAPILFKLQCCRLPGRMRSHQLRISTTFNAAGCEPTRLPRPSVLRISSNFSAAGCQPARLRLPLNFSAAGCQAACVRISFESRQPSTLRAASPHGYRSHQCCESLQTSVLRAASPHGSDSQCCRLPARTAPAPISAAGCQPAWLRFTSHPSSPCNYSDWCYGQAEKPCSGTSRFCCSKAYTTPVPV